MTKRELREALVAVVDRYVEEVWLLLKEGEEADISLGEEYGEVADYFNRL